MQLIHLRRFFTFGIYIGWQNKLQKIAAEIEEIDVKFLFRVSWGSTINQNALATTNSVSISFYGKLSKIIPGREVNYFVCEGNYISLNKDSLY